MVLIVLSMLLITVGGFNLFLFFRSKNSNKLIFVTAKLVRVKEFRNYKYGRLGKLAAPYASEYAYAYFVGEKRYLYSGVELQRKQELYKIVNIVYLKGFPRVAYLETFTASRELTYGIVFCILSLLALFLQILISIN